MERDINVKVLKELGKGAKIGTDSISFVAKKVSDQEFSDELSFQYNQYDDILNRVNDIYGKYSLVPDHTNIKNEFMTWMGVQMNTMEDKSNSKIAELLIQGNTMGIIEGRRLLNNNPNVDQEIQKTLNDFVTLQENTVEKLKTYL